MPFAPVVLVQLAAHDVPAAPVVLVQLAAYDVPVAPVVLALLVALDAITPRPQCSFVFCRYPVQLDCPAVPASS